MALYTSYSDSQITSLILRNVATVRKNTTYEQLPAYVGYEADPGERISGLSEAANNEYEKAKQAIAGVSNFTDPRKLNDAFALEFQSVVTTDVNRVVFPFFVSDTKVRMGGGWPGIGNDFLTGFAFTFFQVDANTPSQIIDQYRRVISSQTVTDNGVDYYEVDFDLPISGALSATGGSPQYAILSFPDRIDLPTAVISDPRQDGTTLPDQSGRINYISSVSQTVGHSNPDRLIILPSRDYITSTPEGSWEGWSIRIIDGYYAGDVIHIDKHVKVGVTQILSVIPDLPNLENNDWFMLIPPSDQFISASNNAYAGMYVRVALTAPSEINYGTRGVPAQTRKIISSKFLPLSKPARSEAVIYEPSSNTGSEFEYPPPPEARIGVSDTYVDLAQLAEYLGIYLDDLDPEALQREQVASAYDFHRIRGTREAVELLCRLRGFDSIVEETASTLTSGDGFIFSDTANGAESVPHQQYIEAEIPDNLVVSQSGQTVPRSYVLDIAGREASRVPDSDVRIYLERVNPLAIQSSDAFLRLYRQIRDLALPAHVDIIFFGLLQRFTNSVSFNQTMALGAVVDLDIDTGVDLYVAPVGAAQATLDHATSVSNTLLLISRLHYDTVVRWGNGTAKSNFGVSRWTTGTTRLI